jgi:hypothetical protein
VRSRPVSSYPPQPSRTVVGGAVAARACALALLSSLCTTQSSTAAEVQGLLDLRAVRADSIETWRHGGMGKLRYDSDSKLVQLGQAVLKVEQDFGEAWAAHAIFSAASDRRRRVDLNEAWLAWSPVPSGPWRVRAKAGAFFPVTSVELDYDSIGWTPERTLSSSAINSWIGEELRTKGLELNLQRDGRFAGSPHDFGVTAALYGWNDPAGTLLAWRGWSISDRITGLSEPLLLADLPAYAEDGPIWHQTRHIQLFRDTDKRAGYYVGFNYRWRGQLEAALLHYDNRADPMTIKGKQWGWTTRFNHASLRWRPTRHWELAGQAMHGMTFMGPNIVNVPFASWYLLASRSDGPGTATVRYDRFRTGDRDILPEDPNQERGHALALAYRWRLSPSVDLLAEWLRVSSDRASLVQVGELPRQRGRSLSAALRWHF